VEACSKLDRLLVKDSVSITCRFPLHHALEELRFLLIRPRIVERIVLRLCAPGVLGCLGLGVAEGCGSCAGLCFLPGRHCRSSWCGVVELGRVKESEAIANALQEQVAAGARVRMSRRAEPRETLASYPTTTPNSTPAPPWTRRRQHTMSSPVVGSGSGLHFLWNRMHTSRPSSLPFS
jgi:hypothetical protein